MDDDKTIPAYFGQAGGIPQVSMNIGPAVMPNQPSQAIPQVGGGGAQIPQAIPQVGGGGAQIPQADPVADLVNGVPARAARMYQENSPYEQAVAQMAKKMYGVNLMRSQALDEAAAPPETDEDKTIAQMNAQAQRLLGAHGFGSGFQRAQGLSLVKQLADIYKAKGEQGLTFMGKLGDAANRERQVMSEFQGQINDADKSEARRQRMEDAAAKLELQRKNLELQTANGESVRKHRTFMESMMASLNPAQRAAALARARHLGIESDLLEQYGGAKNQAEINALNTGIVTKKEGAVTGRIAATGNPNPPMTFLKVPPPPVIPGATTYGPDGKPVAGSQLTPKATATVAQTALTAERTKGEQAKNEAAELKMQRRADNVFQTIQETSPEKLKVDYWRAHPDEWRNMVEKTPHVAERIKQYLREGK